MTLTVHAIQVINALGAMMVLSNFEARYSMDGKSVESSFRSLQIKDRKRSQSKVFGSTWLGPKQYLAFRHRKMLEQGNDRSCPRPRSNDHLARAVGITVSRQGHIFVVDMPFHHPFTGVNLGTKLLRGYDMRNDAALG